MEDFQAAGSFCKLFAFKITQISFIYLHLQWQLYPTAEYRYYTFGTLKHIAGAALFATRQNSRDQRAIGKTKQAALGLRTLSHMKTCTRKDI